MSILAGSPRGWVEGPLLGLSKYGHQFFLCLNSFEGLGLVLNKSVDVVLFLFRQHFITIIMTCTAIIKSGALFQSCLEMPGELCHVKLIKDKR